MITPLSEEQILTNLFKGFHDGYQKLKETHLQQTEDIYGAFNCSIAFPQWTQERTTTTNCCGYCLITTYRRLLGIFSNTNESNVKNIRYLKNNTEGTGWERATGMRTDHRYWFLQPFEIEDTLLKKRGVIERQLKVIERVTRKDIRVSHQGSNFDFMEFRFTERYVSFTPEDGKQVYDLLQYAIQHGGKFAPDNTVQKSGSHEETLDILEKLGELYRQGLLTEIEYESKKKDLLSRL